MNIIDIFSFLFIAILYNIFIHQSIIILLKSYTYEEKMEYGLTIIFISGIIGIVLSRLLLKNNQTYSNSVVSMGMLTGGILLMLTAIIVNWNNISDDIKLFLTFTIFIGVLIYFYSK